MPIKTGTIASSDYSVCSSLVDSMNVGDSLIISIDNQSRCRKYLYELSLKAFPRKEFRTKKVNINELRVNRTI